MTPSPRLGAGALGRLGLPAGAQQLDGLVEVAVGLGERVATGEHARPRQIAQGLDVLGGHGTHDWSSWAAGAASLVGGGGRLARGGLRLLSGSGGGRGRRRGLWCHRLGLDRRSGRRLRSRVLGGGRILGWGRAAGLGGGRLGAASGAGAQSGRPGPVPPPEPPALPGPAPRPEPPARPGPAAGASRRSRLRGRGLRGSGFGLLAGLLLGLQAGLLLGVAARLLLGLAAGALLGLLALALQAGALLLGPEHAVALADDIADRAGDRRARADRVVVAGDHVVDAVGIAVGVDQPDDRDAQALRLADGDRLGLEVDDEHRVGHPLHVLDPAEVRPQLGEVGLGGHPLAGGQQLQLTLGLVALEVVQALDPQRDRLEVGQQTTEPPMVDIGHVRGLGRLLDRVAGLLLGADEEDRPAAAGDAVGEVPGAVQQLIGLQQIDDVDPVALAEDEAAHLGVPAACLVAEMHAGLQQLLDADIRHCPAPLL